MIEPHHELREIDLGFLNGLGLSQRERIFVLAYVEIWNGAEAARRAGYSHRNARQQAYENLTKPYIRIAIARTQKYLEASTLIRTTDLILRWWAIANASPADIVQCRHVACRYCYGASHEYQWRTSREYREALDAKLVELYPTQDAREAVEALIEAGEWDVLPHGIPRDTGGYGFNGTRDPNDACPECDGAGHLHIWIEDTRNLSGATLALFDGVKQTQHGIEMKFLDRAKASELVGRALGVFRDSNPESTFTNLAAAIMAQAQSVPVVPLEFEAGVSRVPEAGRAELAILKKPTCCTTMKLPKTT